SRVAQKLQSSSSPQEITIKNKRYTVIGVLKKQPNKANIPLDINSSIITLMSDNDKNYRPLTTLSVQIAQSSNQDYTQLEGLIRKVFPKQLIYVHDSVQMAKGIERQITNLRYLMLSLGLCCLTISNICVVNCLLATLAERRQEIGIRLSLGASPSQIRDMFLRETTVLAVISAIIGSILAIMLVYGIRFFVGIAVPITFEPLLISFCICVSVAICASCYPAYQAKRLQPIQLMRG
ncbi:MAG: FtsX-like permease family protein, partial [Pseudomonadota bacterium]|nr:FtsX-like permease family protein [Pseudomonadota bacterium]